MVIVETVESYVELTLIYWVNYISNKILGPYERILKEFDSVLSTRNKKILKVREGDEMFAELLKRINILIKQRRE